MSDNIKITDTPDGGCIVEMDGETIRYSKEEIEEMKQDYIAAIRRALADRLACETCGRDDGAAGKEAL